MKPSIFIIFIFCLVVTACQKYSLPTYNYSISIDTVFTDETDIGEGHSQRLTKAVSTIHEHYQKPLGYTFYRNYDRKEKTKADLILFGKLGYGHTMFDPGKEKSYYFTYAYKDLRLDKWYGTYGTLSGKVKRNVLRFDSTLQDSTNFKQFSWDINTGFLNIFIPYHKFLKPANTDSTTYKSFSINSYFVARSKKDRKVAKILTNLINNMMVINQRSYNEIGPYERMPKSKYNYYPNYVSRNKTKANFNIGGELIRVDNKNYKLLLSYEGENINLLTPERLPTEIVFDLETTRSGKYLDFMIQSTKIKGFVFQQLAF